MHVHSYIHIWSGNSRCDQTTHICIYMHILQIHSYIHKYVHVRIYIYIYTHMYTYIHLHGENSSRKHIHIMQGYIIHPYTIYAYKHQIHMQGGNSSSEQAILHPHTQYEHRYICRALLAAANKLYKDR